MKNDCKARAKLLMFANSEAEKAWEELIRAKTMLEEKRIVIEKLDTEIKRLGDEQIVLQNENVCY